MHVQAQAWAYISVYIHAYAYIGIHHAYIHACIHGHTTTSLHTDGDTPMKRKLARIGVDAFLKMCFQDNFVHGDLHPGNILVSEANADKPMRVIFLDAGITTV